MKVVVCDDDPTLRGVVSRIAESCGHTVIAETDSSEAAVELVVRFGAEALVLDLSLPWGSGMGAVKALRERGLMCQIVVFTAFAGEHPDLRDAIVRAVIEKPDFDELERVLLELAQGQMAPDIEGQERRRTPRERPLIPPPTGRTPSGLELPEALAAIIDVLEPSDGVLVVHVSEPPGGPDAEPSWQEVLHYDRLLAVARTLRAVLRTQDRMGVERGALVAVLVDGGRPGVDSVWRRLERAHEMTGTGGIVSAGWAVVEGTDGPVALTRAMNAAQQSIGQLPGDRLWAG